MPPPTTQKEVRQFLGLAGYYRIFVPKYSDIARPLTDLTKKDTQFNWTERCQQTFDILKELLSKEPILKYPDPNKQYTLFTDATKYAWACVLTQEYEYYQDPKTRALYTPDQIQAKLKQEGQGPLCRAVQFLGLYFSFFCFVLCFCFMRHGVFYHLVQLNTINVFKIKTNLYFHFDKVVLYNF